MTNTNTLVTFHIGKGGHFHNQGHVSFVECGKMITAYTDNLFLGFENGNELYSLLRKRHLPNVENLYSTLTDDMENINESAKKRLEYFTGIELGDVYWCDCNGNAMLPIDNDVTGRLDEDGDYDTTYVQDISDCNEGEIRLILEADKYLTTEIEAYIQSEHADIWEEFHPIESDEN